MTLSIQILLTSALYIFLAMPVFKVIEPEPFKPWKVIFLCVSLAVCVLFIATFLKLVWFS